MLTLVPTIKDSARYAVSIVGSVTRKKSPNGYKICPKMISIEK